MTNLEYYKEELKKYIKDNPEYYKSETIGKAFDWLSEKKIDAWCDTFTDPEAFIDWLLADRKETIKLTQWEFDLITANNMSPDLKFSSFRIYRKMISLGYFKGVKDTSMTLREILENCEVIEDD